MLLKKSISKANSETKFTCKLQHFDFNYWGPSKIKGFNQNDGVPTIYTQKTQIYPRLKYNSYSLGADDVGVDIGNKHMLYVCSTEPNDYFFKKGILLDDGTYIPPHNILSYKKRFANTIHIKINTEFVTTKTYLFGIKISDTTERTTSTATIFDPNDEKKQVSFKVNQSGNTDLSKIIELWKREY